MRAGNKTELVNLELILGEEISSDSLLMNKLCHDCADKNETLVRKLLEVRESFESSRNAIAEEKGGITSIKWHTRISDRDTSGQKMTSPNKIMIKSVWSQLKSQTLPSFGWSRDKKISPDRYALIIFL